MPETGVVSRRRRRKVVAAVVVTLVVASGTAVLVAATDVRPSTGGGAAAAFVPADGAVGWSAMPGGVAQHEQRLAPGVAALFAIPQAAQGIAIGGYATGAESTPHWVTYWGPEAGRAGASPTDLYSLTPDGIRIVASTGFPLDSVFVPGLLVLPRDAAPGVDWTSKGESVWAGIGSGGAPFSAQYSYAAKASVRAPKAPELAAWVEDGCLETVSVVTLTPAQGDALTYRQTSLWCPGRGSVATTGAFDGDASVTIGPSPDPKAKIQVGARVPSWQHPEHWDAAPVPARWADAVWGDSPFAVAPALRPVMVGDRLAVADVNSGDITLLAEDPQGLVVGRVLRPGGDVIALAGVGDVLLAATSQRDLVAYTVRGDRAWTRRTPDLVVTAPVWSGGDGVVIACLDGTVRMLDAASGEDRWVADVSGDGVEALVVAGPLAIAADRGNAITAVDLSDGSIVWTDEGDDEITGFAVDGETIFVARGDRVERLDPASGAIVWKTDVGTGTDDLVMVGDSVVAQTWRDLVAIDPVDGGVVWHARGATAIVTDGSELIATGGSEIRLVADDGTDAATWPVAPESLGSFRYLTPAANAVWLSDAKAGIVKVGP
jgi:outer membrane protein assembly factor BamB